MEEYNLQSEKKREKKKVAKNEKKHLARKQISLFILFDFSS